MRVWLLVFPVASALIGPACVRQPPATTYFQQNISPILQTSCARAPTGGGCHVADAKGYALGNLDVTSYANVAKRRDLLVDYGPYGQPAFLLKNLPPMQVDVIAYDGSQVRVTTDVRHAGGPIFDPSSTAYLTLRRWISSGAMENGGPSPVKDANGTTGCDADVPSAPGFDPGVDPMRPDFSVFRSKAGPALVARCASTQCHGATGNQLHLTCGSSPEQVRWNYFATLPYIGATTESSELLRRPLAPSQGGSFHEGGVVFQTSSDDGYQAIAAFLDAHGPGDPAPQSAGFEFFAHRVQPVLVRKGCMLLHCHSGASFHDYRLRGGSAGSFSLAATKQNYNLTLAQVALESDDPAASRIIRKNLFRPIVGGGGIAHRGGSLFEDFGNNPPSCQGYDLDQGDLDRIPAYCVIAEWVRRERQARALAPLSGIVYVKRSIPKGRDRLQDFDEYEPGADLRIASVSPSLVLGADVSVSAGCGLDPQTADIRRPAVSWDAKKIAFAARSSAAEPLRIYEMNADGTQCAPHAGIGAHPPSANGLLIHDFDPAYSPPDAERGVHLLFASTRGNLDDAAYDYHGPQRTPADLSKPNANIYSFESNRVVQLTFLLNMERAPSFMQDGRAIFTVEKRAPGFYQLALRRINVDGGDYHPLYGQRQSIGFDQVSQVVHLADKNFAAIFSQHDAKHHGGLLGIFNRSIGVDFRSTNPSDYPIDPSVIDPSSPASIEPEFFLHSLEFPDRSIGTYASPAALPNGKILASFGAGEPASFSGDYDLWIVDPISGAKTKLLGDPGVAEVDAVPIFARATRTVYRSKAGEPNAYRIDPNVTYADVTLHDARVVLSLMFQNTPTGRPVESDLGGFDLWESLPPPLDLGAVDPAFVANDAWGSVWVKRRHIGHVPIASDGSAHYRVPGGVPYFIELPEKPGRPRLQREEAMLSPGESVREAMSSELFDGFCGHCHGARSGRPLDVAMRPDILTGASKTLARTAAPTELFAPPGQRGPIAGP